MVKQQGRDSEEQPVRRDGMTESGGSTARRAPNPGTAGEREGVDSESVDFDDMGDLDRGADDATNAEPSSGSGPGYGMSGGAGRATSRTPELSGVGNTGSDVRDADLGSQGQGAGTGGLMGDPAAPNAAVQIDSTDLNAGRAEGGAGRGTAPAMRISSDVGSPGSGIADDEGFGQGSDTDLATTSVGDPATGTPPRAGLGGTSSGRSMEFDPTAGSGMPNPADMGEQS